MIRVDQLLPIFNVIISHIFRHPPPATGRDDDITKLMQILDDTLIKTDHISDISKHEKILFEPDNKIGSNGGGWRVKSAGGLNFSKF
jgi:hypothetical protein